jgi:phosphotriesterase-related protein
MAMLVAPAVLGPVPADALGFVLPHEHLTVDNRIHHAPQPGIDPSGGVTAERYGELRVYPHAVPDNLVLDDDAAVLADLRRYRALGGTTLVELTPKGMGRDLARLRHLSEASGVTIIAGTGWYVQRGHGDLVAGRTMDDLAAELVADLTGPEGDAGVIGEIGISREDLPDEARVLDAALEASARTGAPVWIHQTTTAPMRRLLDRLGRAGPVPSGLDRSRVVLCHTDYDLRDIALHREALAMGLVVELDLFGMPVWNRRNWVHAPDDTLRVERLLELAAAGQAGHLLISQDVCLKIQLGRYGGFGYGHLLAHVRELFHELGGDAEDWRTITEHTPARLLAWRPG